MWSSDHRARLQKGQIVVSDHGRSFFRITMAAAARCLDHDAVGCGPIDSMAPLQRLRKRAATPSR